MEDVEMAPIGLETPTIRPVKGVKFDHGKPQCRLIPPRAIVEVSKVLTFGAKKYSPENWRLVPQAKERYMDAALRHIFAHNSGEALDAESGLPHLAHAVCCLLFIMELPHE